MFFASFFNCLHSPVVIKKHKCLKSLARTSPAFQVGLFNFPRDFLCAAVFAMAVFHSPALQETRKATQ
jgi:hypothetical protein